MLGHCLELLSIWSGSDGIHVKGSIDVLSKLVLYSGVLIGKE